MITAHMIPLPSVSAYSSVRLFFAGLEDLWYTDLSDGSASEQSDFLFTDMYIYVFQTWRDRKQNSYCCPLWIGAIIYVLMTTLFFYF